jgi:RimJ/RimL family protein N-acetyltransferase
MLEGEFVRLRALRRDDLSVVAEHYNDEEVVGSIAFWDAPCGADDAVEWFERNMKERPLGRSMAIARLSDDAFMGSCGLYRFNWRARTASLGIAIWSPEGRDRGYGTDAVRLLHRYAFDTLNLNRIELSVFADNARAQRVYEKAGFVTEGRRRQAWFWNGAYRDIIDMGVLRDDYEKLREQ